MVPTYRTGTPKPDKYSKHYLGYLMTMESRLIWLPYTILPEVDFCTLHKSVICLTLFMSLSKTTVLWPSITFAISVAVLTLLGKMFCFVW
jgi:hypothetical protein